MTFAVTWKHPIRPTPLTLLASGRCEYPYGHTWQFEEGERVPTVAECCYVERFAHERATCPGGAWCQPERSIVEDIRAFHEELTKLASKPWVPDWAWIDGVAYQAMGFPPKLERVADDVAARWEQAFAGAPNVADKLWVDDTKGAMRAGCESLFGKQFEE